MKSLFHVLQLNFLPIHKDLGLLVLRVWLGLSMLLLHGWPKLIGFSEKAGKFPDPLNVGHTTSLCLAIGAEVVGSVLLIAGFLARLSSLGGAVTMAVAFFLVHNAVLTGEKSGELGFIYLAGYVALFIAGPGRFSLDASTGGKV